MPLARSGEVRLHYESTGAGRAPVMLVMGLGMNATGWWRTVPVLAERFRVLAFDNRGVGRSDRPSGPYATALMADDAVAVDSLAFFERRAEMPAVEAVWASVPYNYAESTWREHGQRVADDIAQRLRFPIEAAPYRAQLAAAIDHDALDRLGTIGAPTLVVHGAADRMVHPDNAVLLAESIPGAELRTWPDAGHLYLTDEPAADAAIATWLSERSSLGPS